MDKAVEGRLRSRGRGMLTWAGNACERLADAAFRHGEDRLSRFVAVIWIAGLYLGGVFLWWYFLNGGAIQLELHDWAEVTAPRYAFLRDAVVTGQLPLHMPNVFALRNVTDRFISVADTNLSPQIVLLRFLDIGQFIVANTVFLYTLGFLGMLALRKRYRLSLVAFSSMFLLMTLNGHISDHLAVGHANWAAVFLMPVLAFQVLDAIGGNASWRWTLATSFLLFFIFLQGAFHTFVHCLLFLAVLALCNRSLLRPLGKVVFFSLMLSMVRILPPLLEASRFDTEFLGGFVSVRDLLSAFVDLRLPVAAQGASDLALSRLGWWELDYYIGAVGLVFVAYYGLVPFLRRRQDPSLFPQLIMPIFLLAALSVGRLYKVFHILSVPLLSSQRVSSRLLIVPLSMLVVLAVLHFQQQLDSRKLGLGTKVAVLGALMLMAQDLWQHFKLWRVVNMGLVFPPVAIDLSQYTVANHPDPPYFAALSAGLFVSLVTFAWLIVASWREKRARLSPDPCQRAPAESKEKSSL
jgi:hypothetical protein